MHRQKNTTLWILSLLALGLLAAPALAGPPPFTTTELIAGNNAPGVNGALLLAAVAAAGPNTLIKLEPGFYDLQGQQIVLPNFVDIEGSGRDITTVFSSLTFSPTPTVVDVAAGINGELRDMTILAAADTAVGVTTQSDEFLMTEVNVEIEANSRATGVIIRGASARLDEVFVRILGSNGNATGFDISGGGAPALTSCLYFATNVQRRSFGVFIDEASPVIESTILFSLFNGQDTGIFVNGVTTEATVRNVRATVQGDDATGIKVQKLANARVKESTFQARSDGFAAGIFLEEGNAKVTESTFEVSSLFFFSLNVFGAVLRGPANLDSNQSNYESTSFAVQNAGTGQARFGASQLIGTASPALAGPLVCVHAYNGAYAALNNFCN
ncbi:MAG: hypothetical protein AAGM22_07625 [Acidobacteriota bacterium]